MEAPVIVERDCGARSRITVYGDCEQNQQKKKRKTSVQGGSPLSGETATRSVDCYKQNQITGPFFVFVIGVISWIVS
jgi:hypothetical protein